ncbi:hypothetical protein Tco_0966564 [Tanacetum coccineum]
MITRRTRRFPSIYLPFRELESRKLWDSRTDKTSDGPEVKAMDTIIARTWNLVDRSLTFAKICPFSDIVPSTVDTRLNARDEALTIRSNMSNGYAPIVASKQSCLIGLHILDQKELNMRPSRLLRLLSDFDYKIWYHPGKENIAIDALRRNERDKPENVKDENLHGMDKELRLVLIELPALGAGVGYHALET